MYDTWLKQRDVWFKQYPTRPIECGILRLDIELKYPKNKLSQIPIRCHPHVDYDPRECFYVCDDWSTIFDVWGRGNPNCAECYTLRMLVESSHPKPTFGEPIRLMSTSCSIIHEHWAARKNWNDFAFFRGRYWQITWNEYFGDWPGGIVRGLPFQDRRFYDVEL